jgi:hypothetical protein
VDYFQPNVAPYFTNEPPLEFIAQNDSLIESIKLPKILDANSWDSVTVNIDGANIDEFVKYDKR